MEWSAKEFEDQIKDIQLDIEKEYRDAEQDYHDIERDFNENERDFHEKELEHLRFYYQAPDLYPLPPMKEFPREHRVPAAEKIIRQELIDDGLAVSHKKYIIDLDSGGMYINGEKQQRDVFRKYKHLLESLEVIDPEGEETYRLLF